jgi:hypothetical protein
MSGQMPSQATRAAAPSADQPAGLSQDELRAEQAGDLPDREAMSILDVGGLPAGLPLPGDVDIPSVPDDGVPLPANPGIETLDGNLPIQLQPIDAQPVDDLPIHNLPVDVGEPPTSGGGLIGIPEQPAIPIEPETLA